MQLSSTMFASSRPSLLLTAMTTGNVWAAASDRRISDRSHPLGQWKKARRLQRHFAVHLRPSAATKEKLTANMRLSCCKTEWEQNLHYLEDMLALWPRRWYSFSSAGKNMTWHRQRRSLRVLKKCSLNPCPWTAMKTAPSALLNAIIMSGIWICNLRDLDLRAMRLIEQDLSGPLVLRNSISHS